MLTYDLTYRLSERQFMRACSVLWAHSAVGPMGNMIAAGVLGLLALFMLWQGVPGVLPWGILLGSGAIFVLNGLRDRLWRRYYRGAVKFTAPITAHLSSAGVGVTSAEGENRVPWRHFKSFAIADDTLFLIIDHRQFSIIPLSACADAQTRAKVEELVKSHLKPLRRRLF